MNHATTALALALSIAAALPRLPDASQGAKAGSSASQPPVQCDEMNPKARALMDAGRTDDARTFLTAAVQSCAGTGSRADNQRLASALLTLGVTEATDQPAVALQHFRRAMALDPENMRGPQNVGGMLITMGQYAEALSVLEKALTHGSDDPQTRFRLEFNAGLALLKMCADHQPGCDGRKMEDHFLRASELNPASPDTWFNLAAIANDVDHDSRRAMDLFKKACDLGHKQACVQYDHFKSQFAAIDRQMTAPAEMTADSLGDLIRQTYPCPAVTKTTRNKDADGIITWTVECSGRHAYTVMVGKTGETTVMQKSK
jgi:tetratricopeptide (TPR) repeat protein